MRTQTWNFHPFTDKAKEATISVGSAALFGLALSQIFNPVALAAAATYGVLRTGYLHYTTTRANYVQKLVSTGYLEPLERDHEFQKYIDEIATSTKMKPHTAYYADEHLVRGTIPWYVRPFFKMPEVKEMVMKNTAFVSTTMDIVVVTREFLDRHSRAESRFIGAHEMSHAKVEDSTGVTTVTNALQGHAVRALAAGLVVTAAAGMLGIASLPAVLTTGLSLAKGSGLLFLAANGATIMRNFAARIKERRADRNAVYLTRDLEAGIETLRNTAASAPKPRSAAWEISSHPSYFSRVANMRKAFAEASLYPPLPTAVMPAPSRYKLFNI